MVIPLLKTKLHIPLVRPGLVSRLRLIERLDERLRLGCKLTLLSAPAGFGKTTLVGLSACNQCKIGDDPERAGPVAEDDEIVREVLFK